MSKKKPQLKKKKYRNRQKSDVSSDTYSDSDDYQELDVDDAPPLKHSKKDQKVNQSEESNSKHHVY